jgi:hypothetical protein
VRNGDGHWLSVCAPWADLRSRGGQPSKRGRCVRGKNQRPTCRDNRGRKRRNSSLPRPVRLCSATFASSRRIGRLTVMVKATRVASNPAPPASGDCGPLLARPSVTERQPMACVAQSEVLLASIAAGVTLFPAVHAGSRSSTSPGPGLLPPSTAPASSRPSRSWGKRGRLLDADGRASRERRFRRELTGFQGGGT